MKNALSVLVLILVVLALALNQVLPADAAKGKKKGMNQETLTKITETVDSLTKKIYEHELYSPSDSSELIGVKIMLDSQMDIMPDSTFAPLYYKIGNIFRMRGNDKDAIVCYQTILENFSDTAYGPKAKDVLTQMGVEIKLPTSDEEQEDSEESEI